MEITDTTLIVFGITLVLAYMSMEYKYLYNGLPTLLVGSSVSAVAFYYIEFVVTEELMFMALILHAVGLGVMVIADEVKI